MQFDSELVHEIMGEKKEQKNKFVVLPNKKEPYEKEYCLLQINQ